MRDQNERFREEIEDGFFTEEIELNETSSEIIVLKRDFSKLPF